MYQIISQLFIFIIITLVIISCNHTQDNTHGRTDKQNPSVYQAIEVSPDKIQPPEISRLTVSREPQVLSSPTIHHVADKSIAIKDFVNVEYMATEVIKLSSGDENYPVTHPIKSQPKAAPPPKVIEASSTWRKNQGKSIHFNEGNNFPISSMTGIFMDNEGAVWACSRWNGVVKYDGYNFIEYTQASGLKDYSVVDMLFDSEGDIWFGMATALAKYDGESFTTYIGENEVSQIKPTKFTEDLLGNIWVGSEEGLYKIDKKSNTITRFSEENGLMKNSISALHTDKEGKVWITYNNKGISLLSTSMVGSEMQYNFTNFDTGTEMHNVQTICETEEDKIYIGTNTGILVIHPSDRPSSRSLVGKSYNNVSMGTGFVFDIVQDINSNIWVANEHNLSKLHIDNEGYPKRSEHINYDDYNVEQDGTLSLAIDAYNNLWIGHSGMSISKIFLDPKAKEYLSILEIEENVLSISEARNGDIWFTVYNNGLFCLKKDKTGYYEVHQYSVDQGLTGASPNDMVIDNDGNIWLADHNSLSMIKYDSLISEYMITQNTYENKTSANRIAKLMIDDQGDLWFTDNTTLINDKIMTTTEGGVYKWDGNHLYKYSQAQGMYGMDAYDLHQDHNGNYWFSSQYKGMTKYEPNGDNGRWFHFPTDSIIPSISHFGTTTDGSICVYGQDSIVLLVPMDDNGNYNINVIPPHLSKTAPKRYVSMVDSNGTMWIGTHQGIEYLTQESISDNDATAIMSITARDGLRLNTSGALFKSADGTLWAGGMGLLVSADMSKLKLDFKKSNALALQIFINDEEMNTEGLTGLTYTENYLRFKANIIEPNYPHQVLYRHFIEGYESSYSAPYLYKEINYPNLPHGNFTLKIQAKYANGEWSAPYDYNINISPPWWYSWWAYALYIIALISGVYYLWKMQTDRIHQKNALEKEKLEAKNLRNIDNVRSQFFTNLSHEYRTPLTVILGMAAEIEEPTSAKRLILQSGNNLLKLVNQMLDFSKLEAGKLKLDLKEGDLVAFLKYIYESFHSLAEHKRISLRFSSNIDTYLADYDEIKIQHIITNLLSNAIKFTPIGGSVDMEISIVEDVVYITVQDTGIGISKDDLPHVFDRYFQVDSGYHKGEPGTGIGLSFACDLAKLMGGTISAESELGNGATFTVKLIMGNKDIESPIVTKSVIHEEGNNQYTTTSKALASLSEDRMNDETRPQLLIIEDNPEVVSYLNYVLSDSYHIEIAEDGKIGIEKALQMVPDIIISDVMMPQKDGYEVTNQLKHNEATSHVPIILLTAKADEQSRIIGLRQKADAYLAKPFNKEELQIILNNLIHLRSAMQKRYANAVIPEGVMDTTLPETQKVEDQFVIKVNNIIGLQMANANFLVEELAQEIGLSKSQLHRKLKALTGRTTVSYLRLKRLQKAKELLSEKKGNISEVAFTVGFNDPSYFTRVFTKEFGVTPKEIKG